MAFWRNGLNLGTVVKEKSPVDDSSGDNGIVRDDSKLAADAHRAVQPGELTLEEDTAGGLGRHLGLFSTTFLIIGRIIGTGIFSTPSSITSSVGSVGAAMMLWVLGLLLSFSGLCVWLEFGCMFPRSGGEKVYLEAVYKHPRFLATVVFATQAILLGFTASGCIIFAQNILVAANHSVTEWGKRGIAIGVITFATCMHTFIPNWGVRMMNVLGSIKVFILVFIVITGFVVLGGHVHNIPDPHASFRDAFAGSSKSGYEYATALFKVLNAYVGWSNAAYVLNEVRRPVRTLKIAGPLGLGICAVLYILANVAYFAAATPKQVAQSGNTVAAVFFGRVFGKAAERALSVFIALSALGNVMTVTFTQSRVNQELAKEGVLPFGRFWASGWPVGAPSTGLLLHWIPSFIVIAAIPFGDAYNFILDVEGYPSSVINFFVVIGLFILRWQAPHIPRPFKVWLPVPIFFLLGQGFLMVAPFLRPPGGKGDTSLPYWLYPIVGIAVLVGGVVYWFGWRVLMPRLGGFKWKERKEVLKDGTVVTQFGRVKKQ
ncbi:high affinity methionine permease [Lasallia pustulata]|uniref:High affinity methionine permease n=1 Tax=Lasallia pustulata TaxID=136370 RepID=A0A1W5CV22_9LECA|nr:high affinity methionine permease [Lasallia pustulata]